MRILKIILPASIALLLLSCGGSKQTATQTTTVNTGTNSAPVITSLTATSQTVQISGSISLSCKASDAEGDPLSYSWSAGGQGSFSSSSSSATTWTAPSTTGTVTIICSVTDGQDNSSSSISITVSPAAGGNRSPNILSGPTPTKSTLVVSETIAITVQADDPDGDTLAYSWNAAAGSISGSGATVNFTAPSSAQDVTVTVTIEDGKGGSVSGSAVISVKAQANNPPTISSLTCTNTTLLTTQSTTCSVSASDADGDTLSYSWSADLGTLSGSGAAVTYTAPSSTGTATLTVKVSDGQDSATQTTSLTVTTLSVSDKVLIDGGDAHTCVISSGKVYCWGRNSSGQLGDGTTTSSAIPVQAKSIVNAVEISLGRDTSCALLSTGDVMCWGSGYSSTPQFVSGLTNQAASIYEAPNGSRECAVQLSGEVLCIDNGTVSSEGNSVKQTTSDCHLLTDGTVQLATGSSSCDNATSLSSVLFLTRGIINTGFHCALLSSGSISCWGDNAYGELGDNTTTDSTSPVSVTRDSGSTLITTAKALSSKGAHSCAVLADGSVWCWGRNGNGQLGNGVTGDSFSSPFAVKAKNLPAAAQAIGVGANHSCALLVDGKVYCWGYNSSGQLGDGTQADSSTPVQAFNFTVAKINRVLWLAQSQLTAFWQRGREL